MAVVITGPGGGSAGSFTHTQSSASATWPIAHGLNRYPQATVVVAGKRVLADLEYPDVNNVTVTHSTPLAGAVYLI